ncbi:MAG: amidohydrolase family protein, partial [Myxococcota bacterium]
MKTFWLTHGRFHARTPQGDPVVAVRVENGCIIAMLADKPALRPGEQVVDLEGANVVAGLWDAHVHLAALGARRREIDVSACTSVAATLEVIAAAAAQRREGDWVHVWGWDESRFPDARAFDAGSLDGIAPRCALWISRVDGHEVWLNSRAMQRLGAAEVAFMRPAATRRDQQGQLVGAFRDRALEMLAQRLPRPSNADLREDLEAALVACAAEGLVGVHDMATSADAWGSLVALDEEGALALRVYAYIDGAATELDSLLETIPTRSARLRLAGVKLFVDGAMGSR